MIWNFLGQKFEKGSQIDWEQRMGVYIFQRMDCRSLLVIYT